MSDTNIGIDNKNMHGNGGISIFGSEYLEEDNNLMSSSSASVQRDLDVERSRRLIPVDDRDLINPHVADVSNDDARLLEREPL